MEYWLLLAVLVCLRFLLRLPVRKASLLVILGSGGHTGEMLTLLSGLDLTQFADIRTLRAREDEGSLRQLLTALPKSSHFTHHTILRSRRVGQSYFSSIFTTLLSLVQAVWVVLLIRPRMILTNGPGTAVPVCYVAWGFGLLLGLRTSCVYVESVCRVQTLSWSGRLMYLIATTFIVQWESLKKQYPRAHFHGLLV